MKWTSIQHAIVSVEGYLAGLADAPRTANRYKLGTVSSLWWFEYWHWGKYVRARRSFKRKTVETKTTNSAARRPYEPAR